MPNTIRANGPIDLLAFAPVALGFTPRESVVMLTFGGTSFHARVDMPTTFEEREGVTQALLDPCKQHGVERVVFLLYTDEPDVDLTWASLRFSFMEAGIDLIDALHVTNGRFMSCINVGVTGDADVSAHPITIQAAVEHGKVVRRDREDWRLLLGMRDTVDESWLPPALPADAPEEYLVTERAMLTDMVAEHLAARSFPSASLGTVLVGMTDGRTRDAFLHVLARRTDANLYVDLFADTCARAPRSHRAYAASVFAFAAYMAGDGAAAWIGVEESQAIDPTNSLAELISEMLTRAIPPTVAAEMLTTED